VQAQAGDAAGDPVEDLRRDAACERVAALRLPAADEVEALVELGQQPRDLRRIVLEVGVDRHDHVALGVREARRQGCRLAEVPAQPDHADVALRVVQPGQRRVGAVGRAVVDEDRLPGLAERLERGLQLVVEERHRPLLVVNGDDDRDHGG
jgi:hypothetical protein